MKKLLFIIQLLIFSFFLTGCSSDEMRYNGSFGYYINEKFAENLENCIRYSTPTYYYTTGVIQLRKHKLKIVGHKKDMCTIKLYDTGILPPGGKYDDTYSIPMRYVSDLSNIMQQAFREPEYHEKVAVGKAIDFCNKLEISSCLIINSVSHEQALYHYMSAISDFFKYEYKPENENKIRMLKDKRTREKQLCQQMITSLDNLIKSTPNFASLSKEEKESLVCNSIKSARHCRYHEKSNKGLITRTCEIDGEKLTSCWATFNENGIIESQNWGANINIFLEK